MSCLSKKHRINSSSDFNKIYKSDKKWHTHSFVAFFSPNTNLKVAFVASKKVGKAVERNRAKRRLRGMFVSFENKVISGNYIFVAKQNIFERDVKELEKDFLFALKRLELLK
ncbi:ribonuclease P protein component [Malaciobacter mytili]|uniref:Ribonuclease P protein component n=1 Tax=Malaciobacter mytili LMG 24559 TaxID=1032238 RepID=A0AAX2AKL6_9BACT|nr:ribonuclease P protein component [Malaciobacter mytili]AXH15631.1 ribonuclease P, protein component [Malaciobacter mytili LMG 24559]RXI43778.1 ribonuclease P protein component [Malaciobacter mytili]RXK16181.1 ribonuclease P protein component [Malaciobacter mytili LMG 24559]